jgi:hypothetical protein
MRPTQEIRRFFAKTLDEDRGYITPCVIWTGRKVNGYGVFDLQRDDNSGPRAVKAHRYSYGLLHGEQHIRSAVVGREDEIDHLCLQRDCVREGHLELVTLKVNRQRMHDVHRTEMCKRGLHLRAEFERIKSTGAPYCLGCQRINDAKRRPRKKREV